MKRCDSSHPTAQQINVLNLQVLDATLKEITAALLESDVNVKLVASLRTKVKAKVKLALEGNADKSKDSNKKNMMQKLHIQFMLILIQLILTPFYIYRPYLMN